MEVALTRKLKNGYIQEIPIDLNPDMDRFICMDIRYYRNITRRLKGGW